jgi:hypothetical protein
MKNSSQLDRLRFLLIASGAAFAFCSDSSLAVERIGQVMDVEEILQNNLSAVRPEPSLGNIENTEKVLQISEADYSLVARYRASSDGHMRIDVFSEHIRVYSEGIDDKGVWEWPGGKDAPENVYHDGVGALEHGIEFNLFPLARLADRGHDVELVGSETIRDKEYFVLKITLSDGFETFRYVNAKTWLVDLSRDFRAFHPGVDNTKKNLETRYDKWERADGVVFASRSQNVDLETGAVIATALVLDSRYNIAREELDLARSFVPDSAPQLSE